jgi:hypothetical protein
MYYVASNNDDVYAIYFIFFFFSLKGSDAIQGIMLEPPPGTIEVNYYFSTEQYWNPTVVYWNDYAFEKMNRLRILIFRHINFSLEPKHLPNHLRLLDWELYPSKTLPPTFYPRNVIILNLTFSRFTMDEPFEVK